MNRVLVCIIVQVCSLTLLTTLVIANTSADGLIKKFSKSLADNRHIQFDAVTKQYEYGGLFSKEEWMRTSKETFYINLPKWRFHRRTLGRSYWRKHWNPFDIAHERIVNEQSNFLVRRDQQPENEPNELTEFSAPRISGTVDFDGYLDFPETPAGSGKGGDSPFREAVPGVLFGYFFCDGKQFVGELMLEAGVIVEDQHAEIHGNRTYLVTSKGLYGRHLLWLDPNAGYLPRKIRIEKSGDDLYGRDKLRSIPAHGQSGDHRPNFPKVSCVYEISNIDIREIDGSYFIVGFNSSLLTTYEGGVQYRRRLETTLENVQRRPDSGGLDQTMELPNGTPVTIKKYPAIECGWQDGKIVKLVDNTVIEGLKDLEFNAANSLGRRSWLLAANVVIIVFIIVLIAYRRMSKKIAA